MIRNKHVTLQDNSMSIIEQFNFAKVMIGEYEYEYASCNMIKHHSVFVERFN